MFASDTASIVNHWQLDWQVPDDIRPRKRCRLDPEDEGTNSASLSGFLTCPFEFPKPSATHHTDISNESGLQHERNCPNVRNTLELGPASLPPRHRRQWNKPREPTVVPRNDTRISSPRPQEEIDAVDKSNIENNPMASTDQADTYKREIHEDSNSESDSESDHSSPEVIPLVLQSRPIEDNDSAIPLDLEDLNAAARGVTNDVRASEREIKHRANPPRRRLVLTEGSVRHPLEGVHVVQIPKSAYNTARRVLVSESLDLPLVTISMRADINFFHRENRYRLSKISLPNKVGYRHVVDATMISDTAILAYGAGPTQISLLQLIEGRRPTLVDLPVQPHKSTLDPNNRGTIACLSPCSANHKAIRFFTGGYDKGIRIWTSTNPEALAFRRSRRSMLVACSKKLLEVNVDHLTRKPTLIPMSNAIHQVHAHKEIENIIILEVDSLDHQIHLYDDRKKNGFDRTPDSYFGRRGRTARHSKGDTRGSLFARGYEDGTACVWDMRNTKQPILRKTYLELGPLVHTSFLNMGLVCYGKNGLTYLDTSAPDSC